MRTKTHISEIVVAVLFIATALVNQSLYAQATWFDGADPAVKNVDELLALGDSAYAHFNNTLAIEYYKEVINLDSTDFRALYKLSRALTTESMDLVDLNEKEQAQVIVNASLQHVDRMHDLYPDRAETQFQLAVAYGISALYEGGKTKLEIGRRVEKYCLRSIEIDPEYAPPYMLLGIFYRKIAELNWVEKLMAKTLLGGLPKGGREKAERYLVQATERNPNIILGWFELGVTRLSLNEKKTALIALENAVNLKPASSNDVRTLEKAKRKLNAINFR